MRAPARRPGQRQGQHRTMPSMLGLRAAQHGRGRHGFVEHARRHVVTEARRQVSNLKGNPHDERMRKARRSERPNYKKETQNIISEAMRELSQGRTEKTRMAALRTLMEHPDPQYLQILMEQLMKEENGAAREKILNAMHDMGILGYYGEAEEALQGVMQNQAFSGTVREMARKKLAHLLEQRRLNTGK